MASVGPASGQGGSGPSPRSSANGSLAALCLIARLHHVAADPAHLAHQLGWRPSHAPDTRDLLLAALKLGLKAKLTKSNVDRLTLVGLPALAMVCDEEGIERVVVLAQCDGQRVLYQDPSGAIQGGRPAIEPVAAFAGRWRGELILVTSRASLAGELARFDFSWFIPSLVKYRRLFGEVLVVSLFLQLFALVSPLFFQVVMDKVLVHRGLTTLDVLVTGLAVVVVFESILTVLRTYVVDATTDVVTEAAAGGTDSVQSSVTFVLGAEVEQLTLTGSAAINGTGNTLSNLLTGNIGTNVLTGGGGNDTLNGAAGADILVGGAGNDAYLMGRGYAGELIQENDSTAGNTDVLSFLSGVTTEQIWFRHVGNDLEVSIIGTTDTSRIQNWYLGSQYRVEQFKTSDGKTLLDSKVQQLVDAMASFTPPAIGQFTLPASYQATLLPVIGVEWGP